MKGTLQYGVDAPDDTRAPRIGAARVIQQSWCIELDPSGLWKRGVTFSKSDVTATLYVGSWPVGLAFREYASLDWWIVAEDDDRQYLVSLDGTRKLSPENEHRLREQCNRDRIGRKGEK